MPRKPWRKYPWNKAILNWIKYNFAIEHEKSIQALVYVGAAFLVIIVGLRGLGDISNTSYIPRFLLNQEGKIDSSIVMIGLIVEFIMLCLLATVSFFAPKNKDEDLQSSINDLAGSVETLAAGVPSKFAETLTKNAQETKIAVENFLNKEAEITESIKSQTQEQLRLLNGEISEIKESLQHGIKDSTNQITDFLQSEKENLSNHFSLADKFMSANRESIQSAAEDLTLLAKNSSSETKGVFEREKEIINNFYNINSGLISKSGEEFREALTNLNEKVEALVSDANLAFQKVTENLRDNVISSSAVSNEVFEREKEMIDKFYKVNSELIAKTSDEFRGILKNYNQMLGQESERLKWLSANQLRPAEYMLRSNKTNDRLVTHLENIDNTLKTLMNEISSSGIRAGSRQPFYKKIKVRWQRLFNQVTS